MEAGRTDVAPLPLVYKLCHQVLSPSRGEGLINMSRQQRSGQHEEPTVQAQRSMVPGRGPRGTPGEQKPGSWQK